MISVGEFILVIAAVINFVDAMSGIFLNKKPFFNMSKYEIYITNMAASSFEL